MESLLVNVSKYAASHKKSPIENFITEAFAWLLRNDASVRESFAAFLHQKGEQQGIEIPMIDNTGSVETQVNFNGKFPDMLWSASDDSFTIIFEHKVWSELHDEQLDNYRQYAEEKFGAAFTIVLITAHAGQHRQKPDIALCWYQIAEIIKAVDVGDPKEHWIREEFIHLLKSNNLLSFSPINPLSIAYYNDAKKIDQQLHNIAQRTANKAWPIQQLKGEIQYKASAYQRKASVHDRCGQFDAWGRIGLEFNTLSQEYDEGGWTPGIFCGFLIDSEDHGTEDLMPNGPLAMLILDIDEPLHTGIASNNHYQALVRELQGISLPKGWRLSDRIALDKTVNLWHPLMFYRDLSEFFAGKTTLEQQDATFFTQMADLQQVLLNCHSFIPFCEDMHRLYEAHQR
ncbi:PD-(D/E)XK nuclease family protein [Vibrio ruber]|uniref:PD-(D/E)XK nuclease family protein n=1 Tax=Vibrio ruber TaxID=184755 RepID=UPI002893262D|nr:PD-(D/E)XK nuclease family protein [Vibrio ruber]WNJ98039.1 PD-(D/E)XK nuclease family protein [Vibrio ruber]